MRTLKMFGVSLALAAGAFLLTMMKDPPRSVAGHPGAVTSKSAGVHLPTDLPKADCLTTSLACP